MKASETHTGIKAPSLQSAQAHYPTLWDLTFSICEMGMITSSGKN